MVVRDKKVDVIYALENNSPIILEVIDTDDIHVSLNRKKVYEKIYDNVGLYGGVDVYEKNINNEDIEYDNISSPEWHPKKIVKMNLKKHNLSNNIKIGDDD